ncbi:MAG: Signal transduction histidine kinase [Anaerocolumna sp.]|nr:Signal transduction histidine kinase [Anaerocolumna sp.]
MNNVKGSFFIKALIHTALFLSGLTLLIGAYHIFNYLDSYKTSITDFRETEAFQSKYLKYVERVAMYVDYREKGYNGTVISDISAQDLSSLFEKNIDKPELSDKNSNQELFNYYNTILNQKNSNFIYYVKNIKTGKVYCSSSLEDKLFKKDEDSDETLDKYLEQVKQNNSAYLILNTETKKFATNVNRGYQYISYEYLSWVIDYIKGSIIEEEENTDTYRGDYIICTTLADRLPNKFDEFGQMNDEFKSLYSTFQVSKQPVPISAVLLITFIILSITLAGHKKNTSNIILNGFDRIRSEISFLIIVVGIIILIMLAEYLAHYLKETFDIEKTFLLAISYTIIFPYCMFGFLSLIRRLKSNTLYSNSFLNSFNKASRQLVSEFISQRSITYRLSFVLLVFILVQVLAFYLYHNPIIGSGLVLYLLFVIPDYMFLIYTLLKSAIDYNIIRQETKKLAEGNLSYKVPIDNMHEPALSLAVDINNISEGFSVAVDEKVKSERFKSELIANVSHDIKTPLTSIINYVDLLKKEKLENEKAKGYLDILTSKTWRLKTLIEDLMEASKASSGSIVLNLECINLVELVRQSIGEFEDKFVSHNLEAVLNIKNEPIYIMADGRSTYRIIENMFSNVNKYALSNTRVYVDIFTDNDYATVSIKNISATKLNINADELMGRFVRGDASRNTEGSGLGLSIAKSLAALQDATFDIDLDGDLFKAVIRFKKIDQYTQDKLLKKEVDTL